MRRALFTVGCLALMVAGEAAPPDKSGVKPSAISLPSGPGSIEGLGESFEPQLNTGMSSYGVKIAVAPGRAGLVPNVRLSYHSGQGNGLAGIGWGMELPVIKRQTDKGFPNYNSLDTFLFSGEELVPINDGNGFWRCENESGFQRFRQVDTDGDKFLDAWEMTERNGTRHYFGQYRGEGGRWSAVLHAERLALGATRFDATYSWMLNTTIDVHGNRIEYEYVLGTGVLYPSRITYAHTGGVSQEVLFSYGKRADAFDDFRPTLCSRLDQRLKTVDVRSAGSRVRMYALDYADELSAADRKEMGMGVPDLSLLCRVVQYGRDGKTANYLPPLMFGYSQGGLGSVRVGSLAESGGGAPGLDLAEQNGETQLADVNGDGLPDLFATLSDGVVLVQRVCLNRGEEIVGGDAYTFFEPPLTVANPNRFSLSQPDTTLLDMNGDGLVDVVQVVDEGVNRRFDIYPNRSRPDEVADSDPDKLGFEPSQPVQRLIDGATLYIGFNDPGTRQIDLNFDKISDFLTISPGLSHPVIQGSYQDRDGVWHHEDRWGDFAPVDMRNLSFSKDNRSNPEVQLVDMNGDRLQDIVSLVSDGGISGQLRVMYWPMRGQGRWAESRIMEAAPGDDLQVGDMNLADVFLEDVTGDGLADLLILDGSGSGTRLTVRANVAGQRWAYPVVYGDLPRYEPRALNQPTIFRFADVNGNGSRDLVFRNDGLSGGWQYVDLLFTGKPNLLTRIDNGLGKNTFITYGTSTQEMQRAAAAGAPWVTRASFPLDVVKRIRTSCGLDLNGDGREDQQVSDFQYRDAFYDGMEREFRGFGFAQRTDYGDDFIYNNGLMLRTGNSSPSAPTLVTRYRFLTGSADGRDNDEGGDGSVDEFTERGGREEEPLKGRLVVEEKLDASVAYGTLGTNFDVNCRAAALAFDPALRSRITPDAAVFSRVRQEWKIRRLYRPVEALPMMRDQDRDGFLDAPELRVASPPGRQGSVRPGNGRSVSFAFASTVETDVLEANGILAAQSGLPVRGGYLTRKTFDHDDYGNQTLAWDEGIVGGGFDDERVVRTTYALGLNALSLWVIDKPDTVLVTDENGAFVAKKIHFYDGAPYGGLQGQIEKRALLHRTREFKTEGSFIEATRHAYDEFGNPIGLRDPNGNQRVIGYDSTFHIYPTSETIVVGRGSPDLSVSASYDTGFGVVTGSTDFNGNATSYRYDTFGRLVGVVRPGDSVGSPTQAFAYQPADPSRGRIYAYDAAGNLSLGVGARVASRVESRQREKAGGGEFITAAFTDGCGKKLGSVAEGASDGTWIVRDAVSYNLRGSAQSQWLPFQISAAGVPQFGDVWTAAGRPPLGDGINPAVVSSDVFQDSVGRVVATVDAPETWGGVRKSSRVQYLPFEERHFDQEDADPGSVHASTPLVRYTDGLGRLIAVEEVVRITDTGEPGSPASWRTAYAYDLNDQLLRIQDSQNNVKTMAYDGLKRMVAMNDPDRGPLTVLYDDASNIRETVDAKGQRITYTYDGANRIKTEDYGDTAGISPDVSFTYDVAGPFAAGNGATGSGTNLRGQIASVRDLSGEIHFSYDARGRKISEIKRIPDRLTGQLVGYRTAFTYDSADRLETLTYPDGDKLNHAYNARSLLSDLSGNLTGSLLGSISYRPSGQIASLRYGNGITTTYTYDPRMRLRTLNTQSPSAQLVGFSYTFDGASNITRIEDVRELGAQPQPDARFNSQTFAYDNLYRLTRVDYPGRQGGAGKHVDYRYDRIGNMLQQTSDIVQEEEGRSVVHFGAMESGGSAGRFGRSGREPGAPPGPHAITRAGASRSYDYDANGNMTTIDGLRCTWDFKDRL